MTMRITLLACSCLLLPSCARMNLPKEKRRITERAENRINARPDWNAGYGDYRIILPTPLTENDVVRIGLERNSFVQEQFSKLGIAKADLVQAGFYSNPRIDCIFQRPDHRESGTKTIVEIDLAFTISDLWQIPLRKRVAKDLLEIQSREIIKNILLVTTEIKYAFLSCIYFEQAISVEKEILSILEKTAERIDLRHAHGLHTQLDQQTIILERTTQKAHVLNQELMLKKAKNDLSGLLRIPAGDLTMLPKDLLLKHPISSEMTDTNIEQKALEINPTIQIAKAQITRARHAISVEYSKIFPNVQLGLAYDKDSDGSTARGALLGFDIPIFDTNYGAIKRAKEELAQMRHVLDNEKINISGRILNAWYTYQTNLSLIAMYEKEVIPVTEKAFDFAQKQFEQMQLSMLVILESQRTLFTAKRKLITMQYELQRARIEIENLLGTPIEALLNKSTSTP